MVRLDLYIEDDTAEQLKTLHSYGLNRSQLVRTAIKELLKTEAMINLMNPKQGDILKIKRYGGDNVSDKD